jgi:hypothetical protein
MQPPPFDVWLERPFVVPDPARKGSAPGISRLQIVLTAREPAPRATLVISDITMQAYTLV